MTNKHDIIWLEETESTNEEARRRISDIDNLSVVAAARQTAGKGQRGNTWSSEAGKNLTFSIVLKYERSVQAYDQFCVSEIAALAVVDLLSAYGIEAKIKWPNDIYVGNKKICGILIENAISGNYLTYSIVGIGLNVNQRDFSPLLPNPTSMTLCKPEMNGFDLDTCMNEFMDIFKEYHNRYLNGNGGYGRLRKLYLSQMWRIDVRSEFIDCTSSVERKHVGIIRGLSDVGNILIEDQDGIIREFGFKEIRYMI